MWRGRLPRKIKTMRELFGAILGLLLWLALYVCVSAFFSSIKRSALRQQPRQDGVALEFVPAARMQFLIRSVLVLLVAFGVLVVTATRKEGGAFYALLIPASVFVLISLVRPVPVAVDDHGIRQRRWFLRDKEIRWGDIASVAYGPNTGTTYVLSKNGGPKIRFSVFLVGRARFKHEIRAHAEVDIYTEDED
jgi:hypothetical protein